LFNEIEVFPKPEILTVTRIGPAKTQGKAKTTRPIKVTLVCPEEVKFVLSKAKKLRQNSYPEYQKLKLSPDRSREERAAHKLLVTQSKQRISDDPSKYRFIRDGKIKTVDKALSPT
jgi:hypothetical protein